MYPTKEEKYAANTKELVGGYVSTQDGSPLVGTQIEMAVLAADVESPPIGTVWHTPSLVTTISTSKVKAQLMIGPGQVYTLTPGRYRCWFKIADAPEEAWRPHVVTFRVV